MGSRSSWSVRIGTCWLGALAVQLSVPVHPALAQHADAGAPTRAAVPKAAEPTKAPVEPSASGEASGVLPKTLDPALLSEATRARLNERVTGRHASALPLQAPELRAGAAATNRRFVNEPLRRGQARTRVQAVETDEGITILSNRLQPLQPAPRLAALVAQQPAPAPVEPAEDEDIASAAAVAAADVTRTHSLRPLSSRSVKDKGSGLGWLLWPFALFVTSAAIISALWFRKKTE